LTVRARRGELNDYPIDVVFENANRLVPQRDKCQPLDIGAGNVGAWFVGTVDVIFSEARLADRQ
jgi:hypothetical protein